MDSLTQAALGSVVGALVLGRQLGRPAIGWGALFGTLPDLEALFLPFLDTVWDLRIHRGLSHSLVVVGLASWGLAKPLAKRWKRFKVTPARAAAFVFAVWSTHVLIDVFTVYGTQVLAPFSRYPVSTDNLFIIDPLFTLPLLVAVVWGLCIEKKRWKKGVGVRMTSLCLALSCFYVGLSFWAKHAARSAFERDLARRGVEWQRMMQAPAPFGIVLWRGLIERDDEIWVGYRSLFDGARPVRWLILPKGEAALKAWSKHPEIRELRRFSKDWCLARETAKGVWVVDLRFGERREWDERGVAIRPVGMFQWEFRPEARGDLLKSPRREPANGGEMLGRLWRRSLGNEEDWDGPPRLIGKPAGLSEPLATLR